MYILHKCDDYLIIYFISALVISASDVVTTFYLLYLDKALPCKEVV